VYASCFKLKHVAAPGQDPLARGWTRGGEIYLWQPKGVKAEGDVAWPPVATVRGELGQGTAPCPRAGGEGGGGAGGGGAGGGGGGAGGAGGGVLTLTSGVLSTHLDTCAARMRKMHLPYISPSSPLYLP